MPSITNPLFHLLCESSANYTHAEDGTRGHTRVVAEERIKADAVEVQRLQAMTAYRQIHTPFAILFQDQEKGPCFRQLRPWQRASIC
jgi:hypothetical protein